jgi:transposase-like protein
MQCVFCHSSDVVRNGSRRRNVCVKQSYLCNACNKQFVEPDGFERMRNNPLIITRAIHMHEDGFSLSKVQNHLWQHDGVKVTRWTISQWTKKYSDFLKSAQPRGKSGH